MNYETEYLRWLNHPKIDEDTRNVLKQMDDHEKREAFYEPITFGTAGMRGILGVGIQRMNVYTIRKATHGFARYIKEMGEEACKRGVAIGFDNRHFSLEFAKESAKVLADYEINSYIYPTLRPTPVLSYAVRELNCIGGIMITASHNPKEYNGYKLYDENGCQLVPQLAAKVIDQVNAIQDELDLPIADEAQTNKYLHWIDSQLDKDYLEAIKTIAIRKDINASALKVVYSPEHGTGKEFVEKTLRDFGFNLILVESQSFPDPDFINTTSPNPEEPGAYIEAIKIAKEHDAHIIIVTDPDADRLGVAIKHQGDYRLMTGNQSGALLLDYILKSYEELGVLKQNSVMFNTVVTSDLGEAVASYYGVETEKTLTGFKFIGDRIEAYDQSLEKQFVFGYEESYGCLISPFVRDKDAIQASYMLCEMAAYYLNEGKDLFDALDDLSKIHGTFEESQQSITLTGFEGAKRIQRIIQALQQSPLKQIGPLKVITFEDYKKQVRYHETNEETILLPSADVLKYYLEDGSWIAVRPSGTEPKCKIYYSIKDNSREQALQKNQLLQKEMMAIIDQIQ